MGSVSIGEKPSAGLDKAGWECKAYAPSTNLLILLAFLAGLVCGLVPLFLATGGAQVVVKHHLVFGCASLVLVLLLGRSLWKLRKRQDFLYLDEHRIVFYRRFGRRFGEMWMINTADVEEVAFRGGSFVRGELSARIRGRGFVSCGSVDCRSWERTVDQLRVGAATLRFHPRLLERLIQLAERKAASPGQRQTIERARRFSEKASRASPPSIPIEDVEALHASLDALPAKVCRTTRLDQTAGLLFCCLALIGLGVLVFFHLRGGSLLDILMLVFPLCLLGTTGWVRLVPHRFKGNLAGLATQVASVVGLILSAVFIWFYPIVWFALAAYLLLVIHSLAVLRFGPQTGRQVWVSVAILVVAYLAAAAIYFTNWQTGRVERIFAIRYRLAVGLGVTISPDAQTLAFELMDEGRTRSPVQAEFVPRRDSVVEGLSRFLTALLKSYPPDLPPRVSMSRIVFVPTGRSEASDLILPSAFGHLGPWSPDSRRIALLTFGTSTTDNLWIAGPAEKIIRRIPGSSFCMGFPQDAWSSGGLNLTVIKITTSPTTRTTVVIHVESGRMESYPFTSGDNAATSPTRQKGVSPFGFRVASPNDEWFAEAEFAREQSRVTIARRKDGKQIATILLPGSESNPSLFWSPDSRKLAIPLGPRIWVHDMQTSRTVVVKAWRQLRFLPSLAWSPDSRSIYFARSIATSFVGVEIVRVHLRE